MIVREMQTGDLDQAARIEEENFSTPWTRQDFASYLEREEGLFIVAAEGEEILGYCGLILSPPEGDITNVSVSVNARGRGAGRSLVEELLKRAEKKGVT